MLTARRHSARCRIKTGVKRDGAIVAREVEMPPGHGRVRRQRPAGGGPGGAAGARGLPVRELPFRQLRRLYELRACGVHALHRRPAVGVAGGSPDGPNCRKPGPRSRGVPSRPVARPRRADPAGVPGHGRRPAPGPRRGGPHGPTVRRAGPQRRRRLRRRRHRQRSQPRVHRHRQAVERRQRGGHGRQHRGRAGGPHGAEPDRRGRTVASRSSA